eukprot:CAMPEP_0171500110 /NCGR_PEP_ID=MMETSP0958-20121227/8801_1 /TAXON_ID=87120 /ORGANISM="Aurantiochytrium limacinum, Strain ATCCMYA-1381" /LENGTH=119 /DNA_ID=CAMNT_0012034739 /DNA_START=409 /DNA_END=769 /DNA_ORIENTATION=-
MINRQADGVLHVEPRRRQEPGARGRNSARIEVASGRRGAAAVAAAVDGDEWRAKMEIPPDHSAEDQTAQGGDGEGAGFAGGGQVNMHATKMWISLRCELSRSSSKGREGYKPHLQGLSP